MRGPRRPSPLANSLGVTRERTKQWDDDIRIATQTGARDLVESRTGCPWLIGRWGSRRCGCGRKVTNPASSGHQPTRPRTRIPSSTSLCAHSHCHLACLPGETSSETGSSSSHRPAALGPACLERPRRGYPGMSLLQPRCTPVPSAPPPSGPFSIPHDHPHSSC